MKIDMLHEMCKHLLIRRHITVHSFVKEVCVKYIFRWHKTSYINLSDIEYFILGLEIISNVTLGCVRGVWI